MSAGLYEVEAGMHPRVHCRNSKEQKEGKFQNSFRDNDKKLREAWKLAQ